MSCVVAYVACVYTSAELSINNPFLQRGEWSMLLCVETKFNYTQQMYIPVVT